MDFRIVGSKGSLDIGWDKVVLKTIEDVNTKVLEVVKQYGHHFNFIKAIRMISHKDLLICKTNRC